MLIQSDPLKSSGKKAEARYKKTMKAPWEQKTAVKADTFIAAIEKTAELGMARSTTPEQAELQQEPQVQNDVVEELVVVLPDPGSVVRPASGGNPRLGDKDLESASDVLPPSSPRIPSSPVTTVHQRKLNRTQEKADEKRAIPLKSAMKTRNARFEPEQVRTIDASGAYC
jgi:hypothetical protein